MAFTDRLGLAAIIRRSGAICPRRAGVDRGRGRKASDRGAYSRFQKAVSEAKLTRFIKADFHAESFSYDINESVIEAAERFDGKLVLLSNVADFSAEKIIDCYKALADIERGFRVLKSDLEIAPVFHRLPDRIRTHRKNKPNTA